MLPESITTHMYFWGSLVLLGLFAAIFYYRPDLRRRMIRMGIAVGILGVLSEAVFFQDYWHPPLVIRFGRFGGIEDFFFGFSFGGICVALYDVVFHKRLKKKGYPHYWIIPLLVISEVLSVSVVGPTLGISSIYSSALGFIVPALLIMIM